jgi:hypothetical protein
MSYAYLGVHGSRKSSGCAQWVLLDFRTGIWLDIRDAIASVTAEQTPNLLNDGNLGIGNSLIFTTFFTPRSTKLSQSLQSWAANKLAHDATQGKPFVC